MPCEKNVLYCITAAGEAAGGRIMRGKKYEQCREAEKIALRRKKRWVTPQQNNTKRAKVAVVDHSDDVCASAIQQYFQRRLNEKSFNFF